MNAITETLEHVPAWAGSVPGWIMAISFLGILWKGLPAVLDSWSNSVAKEREHRQSEIARLEKQIKDGDDRHSECMEGQRSLRIEIAEMQTKHTRELEDMQARHMREVERLQQLVSGMVMQLRQVQLSALRTGVVPDVTPEIAAMLAKLGDS
jgi:hypothetical protein